MGKKSRHNHNKGEKKPQPPPTATIAGEQIADPPSEVLEGLTKEKNGKKYNNFRTTLNLSVEEMTRYFCDKLVKIIDGQVDNGGV